MPETPFVRGSHVSSPPDPYIDLESMIAERVPTLREIEQEITYAQLALVAQVAPDASTHESVRLLFNLAVNDFFDLLQDLNSGSGRSAMRTARAVIEHAINLHTVAGSLAEASSYLEHLDQGPAIMLSLSVGADRLEKRARRSYRHTLNVTGAAAARRFDAAVAEHGSWFKRGWTPVSLRDRADSLGLASLYEYYRLASLVTHGSAGGALGSLRDHPAGYRVFRTGHALELAPVALWAGLAGYREVLRALQQIRSDLEIAAYSAGLISLDGLWADYFSALREIDIALWPAERITPPRAILAFSQKKTRRWYLHVPMMAVLIPSKDPDLPDWIEQQVEGLIDRIVEEHPNMFRPDQRWLTAEMLHVTVTPAAGAHPIPDSALLQVPGDGWELRELPEP